MHYRFYRILLIDLFHLLHLITSLVYLWLGVWMRLLYQVFANLLCWYKKTCFDTFFHSQMWSNRSACEQDFADLLCVISVSIASIPVSTNAVFPRKKDFSAGFIFSNSVCWSIFSIEDKTSKLDLSRASTVLLLHRP